MTAQRFAGRVAIVTGAGGSIGRATARRFAADGAQVVVADIDVGAAEETVKAIDAACGAGRAQSVRTDMADEASVESMMQFAVTQFGRIDFLHNNAAVMGGSADLDLTALDFDDWQKRMTVNAGGIFLGCKHVVPHLRRAGGGVIVNMASVSGLIGFDRNAAYGSSKAAIVGLTRYVATMYGGDGIRCVAVAPGLVTTQGIERFPAKALAEYAAERCLPWPATPDDIAAVVTFLASDEARAITGQTIVVDSGTTAHRPRHSMGKWQDMLREHPEWLDG